ncbi:acetylcholinesterase 4 [Chrysoperla carnea]|uniref:acetylcholinesterase 4 n=1 Tax=Chrysoperla carnea TaxID=189513 RepID=UPI001D08759B|nr:acetylcholinesterase 4 [Chrysoperla carnea]
MTVVQIYPENYPNPIHAYLGIPYALPPIGSRRFAPPEKHPGWNKTLYAANIPPNCPHLPSKRSSAIEQHQSRSYDSDTQSEDCLYLNIWTPVISKRMMNTRIPVLVFFDGNHYTNVNDLHPIPGQDLAAEGIVVITANYRLNVFGFLCFGNHESRGNMGLFDQYMVLLWIQENISQFGGDPNIVTFMGYSSGATSILYHLTSPRTKDLFSHVILMSSDSSALINNYEYLSYQEHVINNSLQIAQKVGCPISDQRHTLQCLRYNTSTQKLLSAFEGIYSNNEKAHNNYIPMLGPIVDNFLPSKDQYIIQNPLEAFKHGQLWNIPILIGFNNLEVINVLYDAPIIEQIKLIQKTTQPIYFYIFTYSDAYDLNVYHFNFTGSIHGNDLPYLFGPTLFQQITRRRPKIIEKYLMKQMKALWSNFIKIGHPTVQVFNTSQWRPFNDNSYIQIIGASSLSQNQFEPNDKTNFNVDLYLHDITFWNDYLIKFIRDSYQLCKLSSSYFIQNNFTIDAFKNNNHHTQIYRHATYTLTGLVIALLILLFICIVLIKQRSKERFNNIDF